MRSLPFLIAFLAAPAWAEPFNRPIPQAQSATAEFWFALASLGLVIALIFVQRLVMRK